jgi:two-component system nitrogen regulation sensor histidine kinase NtrY
MTALRSLRGKLILYLSLIHLLAGGLCWRLFERTPLLLLAAEVVFASSLFVGLRLVRALFVPLELLRTGTELIGERDFSSSFRETGQPELDALAHTYNGMVRRLREERLKLEEQHHFLERLLSASPAGVVTLDFDGRISSINPRAETLLETTPTAALGRALTAAPIELGEPLSAIPVGDARVLALSGGRRLKASRAEFFDRGFPRSFYLLEELTGELRASEKAAYGKLIRMMSHEINNSVGAVSSLLDSFRGYAVQLRAADSADFLQATTVAITRLENLRSFTSGFADVVRLPKPETRPTALRELVDELVLLLRPEMDRRGIECSWAAADSVPSLLMDRNQIEQALVNVFRNAIEAIDENGVITLRLLAGAGHPVLSIADTGSGVADDVAPLLFTPFFSTKRNGRGLGLTLVQEILSQHGFGFRLAARPGGRGAEFQLLF